MCIGSIKKDKKPELCISKWCTWVCDSTWNGWFQVRCRICWALIDTLVGNIITPWKPKADQLNFQQQ